MTDLSRKLEIEPIAEPDWRRIENGLFEKLDREPVVGASQVAVEVTRRAPWRGVFALAVVGAVGGIFAFLLLRGQSPDHPTLQSSRVVTNESSSHVDFGGVSLDVAPESALVVSGSADSGVLIVLESGAVRCSVEPRGDRPPVAVQAGDVRVEVVGTIFSVIREGNFARVSVEKGVVRVVTGGEAALVSAGERWPTELAAGTDGASDETVVLTVDEAGEFFRRRRRPHRSGSPASTAEARALDGAEIESSRKERYKRAERLEASDPSAAIAVYRELAKESGPWAENALFAHGRLELERGNSTAAARLFRSYVRRYPRGANHRDATELLEGLQRK